MEIRLKSDAVRQRIAELKSKLASRKQRGKIGGSGDNR